MKNEKNWKVGNELCARVMDGEICSPVMDLNGDKDEFTLDVDSLVDIDLDDDELEDELPLGDGKDDDDDDKVPEKWDLINAFDNVLAAAHNNRGKLDGSKKAASAMEYLQERLQMTQMQIIVIAMLIDSGRPLAWSGMANFLGMSRIKMMTFTDDIEELVSKRRWLMNKAARVNGSNYEGYGLVYGVITAIRHNKPYEPENFDSLDEQAFVERMTSNVNRYMSDRDLRFTDDEGWLMSLVEHNMQLPLCQMVSSLEGDIHDKCLFLLIIADYARYAGDDGEGLDYGTIDSTFPDDWEVNWIRKNLVDGTHELITKGYVEHKCEDGMADCYCYRITQKTKGELLAGFKPSRATLQVPRRRNKPSDRDVVSHNDIATKTLFYNEREGKMMERLTQMLSEEQFPLIQKRLKERGMRTGVAVLLSGGPGTGKTESVRQLARQTGRDLLMIDISQVKDKYVGESEKNTKAIFDRYKALCKAADEGTDAVNGGDGGKCKTKKPILFINECDAILGKRFGNPEHSADKMQNSMQNILLQALEDLDGVIICTTNLAASLDKAFERRFLMKVEFDKPSVEVRSKIWQSMLPSLSGEEAHILSERYELSGGQCENVMRKVTIDEIINGGTASFADIESFCQEEIVTEKSKVRPVAGFCV